MELKNAQSDTLLSDMAQGATAGTLTGGNFGTPATAIYLTFDYDVAAKYEVKLCTVAGAAITNVSHVSGANIAHSAGCKVGRMINAEVIDDITDGTSIEDNAIVLRHMSDSLLSSIYPIGSIYTNASVNTNPSTLLGFGTWTAFGAGRVLVGVNASDTEFDTLGETGGAKTHTLQTTEMPSHTHIQNSHTHAINSFGNTSFTGTGHDPYDVTGTNGQTVGSTTATNQNTGGGGAHNNLQPYITVYMWKRTT